MVGRIALSALAVATSVAACGSFELGPYLNEAVGRPLGSARYPLLDHSRVLGEADGLRTIEYSISSLGRCRWIFDVDTTTGVVKSWRYPDKETASRCRGLAS